MIARVRVISSVLRQLQGLSHGNRLLQFKYGNIHVRTCRAVPSGWDTYGKFYPEKSSDGGKYYFILAYHTILTSFFSQGVLRLGNIVPDFSCETTHGHWDSFHKWIGDSWCILFSHPADFTPGG